MKTDLREPSGSNVFEMVLAGDEMRFRIPSRPDVVERLLAQVERFFENELKAKTYALTIVLRELVNNAVRHGNGCSQELAVAGSVERLGQLRFRITVEDEGMGFDYRSLDMSLPEDPRRVSNRGYALIGALSEDIEFNEKGNRVTTFVSLADTVMKDQTVRNALSAVERSAQAGS